MNQTLNALRTLWAWLTFPGVAVRRATAFVAGSLIAAVLRHASPTPDPIDPGFVDDVARTAAFASASTVALVISMPSILKIFSLGLPATALDLLLVYLGLAVAAQAWPTHAVRTNIVALAYGCTLVFAIPGLVVRVLA